jgi:putative ABC transport system permease protein
MILNYFKIAWRNMMKNKAFSFINIFGLAIGLTCCMLITVYIRYECSYDAYQPDVKDVYQMRTDFSQQGKHFILPATPTPMAAQLVHDFPEIKQATRVLPFAIFEDKEMLQNLQPGAAPLSFYEDKGMLVDSNFFQFFHFSFVEGNMTTALAQPRTVVLSQEIAHKLFGNEPALNKVIHISSGSNGDHDFLVKGVFRPAEGPSHLEGRFFVSMRGGDIEQFMKNQENDFVTNNVFVTYLRLQPGTKAASVEAKLPAFVDRYAGTGMKTMGLGKREFLTPVRDVHLRMDISSTISPSVSPTTLYILASIAAFTLLIACVNFMNLATARSAKRSAEVGIRKVLGAVKSSLIGRFLGESVLMSCLSFLFAWGLTKLLLPAFNTLTGRVMSLSLPAQLPLLLAFLGLAVLAGLLAGLYPAFYLSSFQPAKVLKGKFSNSLAAVSLRKTLVVFQFMISVILIICTIVINDQMTFLSQRDLGFDKASQIVIPLRGSVAKARVQALEAEFGRSAQVIGSGAGLFYPGILNPADDPLFRDGRPSAEAQRTRMNYVDYGYLKTLGIKAVAGRIFSAEFPGDTSSRIILNESAVKSLGFPTPESAIGAFVDDSYRGTLSRHLVIGVVKDFHFEDLHLPVTPYGFMLRNGGGNYLVVHTQAGDPKPVLASLEASWHRVDPVEPFEYSFLDQDFQQNYVSEQRLSSLIRYFTVMAILISCLGLFGLASFSAEQRIREIGIRKVLGAKVTGIVLLLSKDFIKLVVIAMVIASPLAWLIMHQWLQDFAYKVSISWVVFLLTFISTLAITLLTISFQAIRAGLANPVKSLKAE